MCRAGDGLHGNIFRTTTWTIVPIWQFSAAYSAVTLSSVEDDGLGEELRVLWARSEMGITNCQGPGGITRLDPVR